MIATMILSTGATAAIAGRGGFRGGSGGGYRGGSFQGGRASMGGASSFNRSPSFGGSSAAGFRGGSVNTSRGGTLNYGAAGRGVSGSGGFSAGRGAYGVSGTTAGGRDFGTAGRVGGAVGPGGNAIGGRSSVGAVSGRNGVIAGGSRGGVAVGGWNGGAYRGWSNGAYRGYNSRWVNGSWGGGSWGGNYGGWGWGGVGVGLAGWGLGSSLYSSGWGYMPYTNPYFVQPVAVPGFAQAAADYDYSQPIDTISPETPEAVAEPAMTAFDQARAAFLAKDYAQALSFVDQAIKGTPNNSAAHEFRGVTLFALGRYEDAAGALYGVLSVGPGWDWTTMISLYPDIETYTAQLRALEQSVRGQPNSAPARFVLAYLYLTAGQNDAAIAELKQIVTLQPTDRVSAQILQSLTKGQPDGTGPAPTQAAPPVQAMPPGKLAGTWSASPGQGSTITLKVADDGKFTWTSSVKGQSHTLSGQSTFGADDLTLVQDEGGPPMVGHLTWKDANDFTFQALGGGQGDPGLAFRRTP